MAKVVYALWRRATDARPIFNAAVSALVPALAVTDGVRGIRLNLQDDAVARAEPLRQTATTPAIDAVVQIQLDDDVDRRRAPVDALLATVADRIAAWLVEETVAIPNRRHPPRPGERTEGWSQVCFLVRPPHLSPEAWRHNWQALHTPIAIATQSTFEYVQNRVLRPLTAGAPEVHGIVEECFPADAMDDQDVFFDAVGDPARRERHVAAMMASCARFIALPDGIEVLPTSQYDTGWSAAA